MAIALTKIVDGKPAVDDGLANHEIVKFPKCALTYRLGSSDEEWNSYSIG